MTATASALKNGPAPVAPPKSPLASLRRGKLEHPLRVIVAGVEGVGKSTFAAGAPSSIFLAADSGTSHLDVARLPEPRTWSDAIDAIRALQGEPHEFKTFVVDSLTWLEPLLAAKVCADNGWASLETPGYGKGYTAALEHWRMFVLEIERLWTQRSMHIVLVAHCAVKLFKNPEGEDYERYVLAINDKAAGLVKQWVDVVGFAKHEAFAKRDGKTQRVRGVSTGARVFHTTWSAAYDAKNRFNLPEELPLSWSSFAAAVKANGPERAAELRAQIDAQLAELGDDEVEKKARAYVAQAGDDVAVLAEVSNQLAMKLGARAEATDTTKGQ